MVAPSEFLERDGNGRLCGAETPRSNIHCSSNDFSDLVKSVMTTSAPARGALPGSRNRQPQYQE